jgi:hypothetical protein
MHRGRRRGRHLTRPPLRNTIDKHTLGGYPSNGAGRLGPRLTVWSGRSLDQIDRFDSDRDNSIASTSATTNLGDPGHPNTHDALHPRNRASGPLGEPRLFAPETKLAPSSNTDVVGTNY